VSAFQDMTNLKYDSKYAKSPSRQNNVIIILFFLSQFVYFFLMQLLSSKIL